jgi:hypothetical protein
MSAQEGQMLSGVSEPFWLSKSITISSRNGEVSQDNLRLRDDDTEEADDTEDWDVTDSRLSADASSMIAPKPEKLNLYAP